MDIQKSGLRCNSAKTLIQLNFLQKQSGLLFEFDTRFICGNICSKKAWKEVYFTSGAAVTITSMAHMRGRAWKLGDRLGMDLDHVFTGFWANEPIHDLRAAAQMHKGRFVPRNVA